MSLFLDFAVLFAMGAAPAGVALFVIRRHLAGPSPQFWTATAAALGVLGVLVFLAVWFSVMAVEKDMVACQMAPVAEQAGCEEAGLLVAVVAIASACAVIIYLAGALGLRAWFRRRSPSAA